MFKKLLLIVLMFASLAFAQRWDTEVEFGSELNSDSTRISNRNLALVNSGVYYSDVINLDAGSGIYGVSAKLTQTSGTSTFKLEVRLWSSVTGFADWNEIFAAGSAADTHYGWKMITATHTWWQPWASGLQYRLTGSGTGTATIKVSDSISVYK